MSRQKTLADREQYVVKSNDLIRKTRYDLTTQQQKIVLYAISKIKPEDDINQRYEFNLHEMCNACGIKLDEYGGFYYKSLKDDLVKLTSRQWLTLPDGTMKTISWIGDAVIVPLSDTVYIKFNEHLQPYLFDLREKYTQYRLQNVLVFHGKYAIRMYELLRSYTTQSAIDEDKENEVDISVDDLRYMLAVDSYPRWADFKRFVIDPAIKEINERSEELHVEYFPMKKEGKRSIEKINFVITRARVGQQLTAYQKRRETLDHKKI